MFISNIEKKEWILYQLKLVPVRDEVIRHCALDPRSVTPYNAAR